MTDRRTGLLGGALAALVVVGCGDTTADPEPVGGPTTTAAVATTAPPTSSPPAPVEGLVATIEYSRLFSLEHGFAVGLRSERTEPVTVATMQILTPLFEPAPPTERSMLLVPGGREVVASVAYGAPRCDGEPATTFEVAVVLDTGETVQVPAPEKFAGTIERLHGRECAAVAVTEDVVLRFGDDWRTEGRTTRGELVVEARRPGVAAAVEQLAGSVIFELRPGSGDPIVEITADEPSAAVEVTVSAERCDPHSLIESKKTFVFVAWVRLGDTEAVPVELHPGGAARAALDELFASCAG